MLIIVYSTNCKGKVFLFQETRKIMWRFLLLLKNLTHRRYCVFSPYSHYLNCLLSGKKSQTHKKRKRTWQFHRNGSANACQTETVVRKICVNKITHMYHYMYETPLVVVISVYTTDYKIILRIFYICECIY